MRECPHYSCTGDICVRMAIICTEGKALSSCRLSRQSLWSFCTDVKHKQIPQQMFLAMILFHGLCCFLWSTKEWATAGRDALDPGNTNDIDRIRNCVAECDICDELGSCKCTIRSTACCWVTRVVFCWCCASVTNGTFVWQTTKRSSLFPWISNCNNSESLKSLPSFAIIILSTIPETKIPTWDVTWSKRNNSNMNLFGAAAPQRYHEFLQVEVAHVWPTPVDTIRMNIPYTIDTSRKNLEKSFFTPSS